jgi:hypothetical protein
MLREMNKTQWELVKTFLDKFRIPPQRLAEEWHIPRHEVYRVMLTVNYEVYSKDMTAEEDVLLAVEGL